MAGVSSVRSFKEAKEILARETLGTVIITALDDGEYRVNKKGGREATAAYTSDLTDAVGTGIAMYQKGAW
jgi:predicted nucleic-acid-binding protein